MLHLVLFVAFIIAMLWLFQIVWLDDFYRHHKTNQVISAANTMLENLDNSEVAVLADQLSSQKDVCILLLDENLHSILSSEDTQFCLIHRMSMRDLNWWCSRIPEDNSALIEQFNVRPFQNDRYNPRRFRGDPPSNADANHLCLLYARRITLPAGQKGYMLLNTIITPLDATVATLRSQLSLITFIVLIGAVLLAVLVSRRLSLPIIQTNSAAKELSIGRFRRTKYSDAYREIAELNTTLEHAATDLQKVERLQHELIANISHDLRTPLTMIGGYAEVMRDIPGESTPENMQVIIDETARMTTLVNEIMDFSRLQAGAMPMHLSCFDLTVTMQKIVERISTMVDPKGYTIHFDPLDCCMVKADEARISQVIYNLIGNALTYTGEDMRVTVTQTLTKDRVRISIRDTGRGIPQEELPMLWHRYYRTADTHKRAVIGSGLGLSIVRGILEQHQVPYGVDSQEGEGSIFWFELPLCSP